MKKLFLFALAVLLLAGCSKKLQPQSETTIRERLVPIFLPGDSSSLKLLFGCDSMNQVYLKEITELKGKRVSTELKVKGDSIIYRTKYRSDTVFVPVRDTTYIERPVPEQAPHECRPSGFQYFLIWSGGIFILAIMAALAYKLIKSRLKLPSR